MSLATCEETKPVAFCMISFSDGRTCARLVPLEEFDAATRRWMHSNPSWRHCRKTQSPFVKRILLKITGPLRLDTSDPKTPAAIKKYSNDDIVGKRIEFCWHCQIDRQEEH